MSKLALPIYLDYAATTPVEPAVAEQMGKYLSFSGVFGNPASRSHRFGWQAEEAVDEAREQLAALINADPREIVFTSGATEAINLALKGAALAPGQMGKHIITVVTEHKATLDTCAYLTTQGLRITYLAVNSDGRLDMDELAAAREQDTFMVSVMHVNNETGVVQDIATIGAWCREQGLLLHVDGAQSVGKIAVDVQALKADLLSISAHKFYGPKGAGALYVRRQPRVALAAQMHGGGHERGMRSGTLATHQIVGLGMAAKIAAEKLAHGEEAQLRQLKQRLWQGLSSIADVTVNGSLQHSAPGILNVCFANVEGEGLLMALQDIAVSTGSACTSASVEPSYVLRALGLSHADAHSSIRFSLGRYTTAEEIDYTVELLQQQLPQLRNNKLWR